MNIHQSIFLFSFFFCFISKSLSQPTSWSFQNWQSYSKDVPSSNPRWKSEWKIPDQGGWSWPWQEENINYSIVNDPSRSSQEKGILQVTYPAHSMNPNTFPQGGIGFYARPLSLSRPAASLDFSYKVYFPKNFDFVKGGKLPGLFGGHEQCSDGTKSSTCFSTRFMWRENGKGEIYAYIPSRLQTKHLCQTNGNICNSAYGYSLGRGSWTFKTNAWNTVRQVITLNTLGKQDGDITIYINGNQVYKQSNLVYRTSATNNEFGIVFDTFFGGSTSDFKTPKTQHTYFKEFSLKAH
ncbi:uncharacterized protein BX664DRAFT_293900 [Halteromyces radiatus]|uniref:uncharacterized protein n=1 Tax=Halteromyces radiatus TaxID=101107 RepID=UPI002220D44F|nr:uncharacterized protein BX664DRAFT_293900 [Halteromyces radiatus]KAI8092688.1 hypothetical protein BX664DRAFT_293900 [Halteromyces radiatus]